MTLRLRKSQWIPFSEQLCSRDDAESAGVILAERFGAHTFVARRLLVVPDNGYLIRQPDQLRIDPVAINRLVRPARDHGWSIFTVHTHPKAIEPWFSLADDAGDARLMPSLHVQADGPHGSLVIAGKSGAVIGRAFAEHGKVRDMPVKIVGTTVHSGVPAAEPDDAPWFSRQRLALGEHGQRILARLHVGVVGLGGTGSACLVQLAHLGVGKITMVDGDVVEDSNVSRIFGATTADAGVTPKVEVARKYVERLGLNAEVVTLRGHIGDGIDVERLADCDIVLSCVDRHTPRALLNRLAYRALIPTIDMGSAFRVGIAGQITASAGRVVVVGPERACLGCWGHIDSARLRVEALPMEEREAQAAEGYIQGADAPQPSVVAFNTMLAGAAVIELLRIVTSFAGADDAPSRLAFAFDTGTVRRNALAPGPRCHICGLDSPCREPAA